MLKARSTVTHAMNLVILSNGAHNTNSSSVYLLRVIMTSPEKSSAGGLMMSGFVVLVQVPVAGHVGITYLLPASSSWAVSPEPPWTGLEGRHDASTEL
jgi:hypothetical protein